MINANAVEEEDESAEKVADDEQDKREDDESEDGGSEEDESDDDDADDDDALDPIFAASLGIGTSVQAKDAAFKQWYEAVVIETNAQTDQVKVHFRGWRTRFDTWYKRSSRMLRPSTFKPSSQERKLTGEHQPPNKRIRKEWSDGEVSVLLDLIRREGVGEWDRKAVQMGSNRTPGSLLGKFNLLRQSSPEVQALQDEHDANRQQLIWQREDEEDSSEDDEDAETNTMTATLEQDQNDGGTEPAQAEIDERTRVALSPLEKRRLLSRVKQLQDGGDDGRIYLSDKRIRTLRSNLWQALASEGWTKARRSSACSSLYYFPPGVTKANGYVARATRPQTEGEQVYYTGMGQVMQHLFDNDWHGEALPEGQKGCAKSGQPMDQGRASAESDKTWNQRGDYAGLHYHKKCHDVPFPASQEQLKITMAGSRVFTGETDSRVEAEATKRKRSAPDTFDEEATKASYTQRAQTERVRPSDGEQEGGTAAAAVADPDAAAKSDDQTEQPRRTARKAQKTQVYVPPEARGEALPNGRWEPEKAWSEEEEAMLIRLVEEEAFGGWKTKAEQLGTGRDRDAVRAKAVSIRAEKERELMKGPLPVGTHVEALYHHIKPHDYWAWYPAQVKEVDKRGQTYIIEWYDGDTNLRKQPAKNVRPVPWGVPPPTDQEPAAGRVAQQMRTKRGLESGDEASDDSSEEKDDDEPDEEQDDSRNTKKRQRPVKQHDERDDERSRRKVSKGGLMEEGRYTAERAWTQSELASLISAVHENGPGHWMLTSYIVASESGKNCTPRVLLCLRVCWLTRRSLHLFGLSGRPVRSHHAVGKMWLKLQERRHHTAQDASSSGSDEVVPVMSMRSSAWQHGETVAKKQKNQKQQQAKGETEEDKWTKHASVADVITDRGLPAGSNFMILQCCENQLEGLYHHWRGYIFKYATIRRPKTPPTLYDASTGGLNYPVFETKTGTRLTIGFS